MGIGSKGNENINHFLQEAEKRGDEPPGTTAKEIAEFWRDYPDRAKAIGLQKA